MASVATHNGLFTVISREMQEVEERLQAPVEEGEGLLSVVARYALAPGGKRIRPALLLLSAQACGADQRERGVTLAAAAEMMHAASLLHDDIVDHAATRRGRPSAMARWGSNVSVLVGDFLFSRAIQSLVEDPNRRILRAFADAVVAMSEAEVLQLHLLHDLGIGEADYFKIITGKTAALMSAACRKPVGSDFREGKVTYPVIHVVKRAAPEDRLILERLAASESPSEDDLAALRGLVEHYEAVPATMRLVDEYLARARAELSLVSKSPACHTLHRLVDFVRERDW